MLFGEALRHPEPLHLQLLELSPAEPRQRRTLLARVHEGSLEQPRQVHLVELGISIEQRLDGVLEAARALGDVELLELVEDGARHLECLLTLEQCERRADERVELL